MRCAVLLSGWGPQKRQAQECEKEKDACAAFLVEMRTKRRVHRFTRGQAERLGNNIAILTEADTRKNRDFSADFR